MKTFSVGFIGLGYWGPNILRNFKKSFHFSIKWACDLQPELLEKIKKEYPLIQTTNDINNVMNDSSVDLIVLATPPETHYQLGKLILSHKKHLWIEKPFTTSYTHAQELVHLAKKSQRYLHVDLPFIFHGPVMKLKELIEKKRIGTPFYYSSIRTNLGMLQKKTNVVWDLAPHDLSILFYLFPQLKLQKLTIDGSNHINKNKYWEIANITLHFQQFTAYLYLSWLAPNKVRLITLGGEEKMIVFDDLEQTEKIKVYDKNVKISSTEITPFKPIYRIGDVSIPSFDQNEALYNQIEFLYNKLLGKKFDYYTANFGLKILKILEKCKQEISYNPHEKG